MFFKIGETYAGQCIAHGLGLSGGIVGITSSFAIESKDKVGNSKTVGGDIFEVLLQGPETVLGKLLQQDGCDFY
jgi:hypothetical protein